MIKLISNQLSPNFTFADALHATRQIFSMNKKFDQSFEAFFGTKNYLLTNTARTALACLADTIKIPKTKKIGIPAFICAVVATPFLERGYEICWIDTDENGLISSTDFEKKSDEIGLVIVPHIFGQRAPIGEISKIAKEKKANYLF